MSRRLVCSVTLLAALLFAASSLAQSPAPAPPLGWNSWDAYGLTIDEADYRANTTVLAGLRQYGWTYSVIDEGWYMQDPFAPTVPAHKYVWDANGILIPAINRFPSSANGQGFKPLADWVHAQGLKFGIHIVRGIPRQVVDLNLPIADTSFHAKDAADLAATCPWDEGNYGIADNAAGQAYYDSMLRLYAAWGLDFIKVDCISDHPYRPTEIRQIADAIRKTGRPIVLSLSPGPTQLAHVAEIQKYAQMWRITNDHWDGWQFPHPTPDGYPFGLQGDFDMLARWSAYTGPGSWPDPDMLPEGWLGPHPGIGQPRTSRYTPDEQRTEFTLWAISRSPLIMGANLTRLDPFTRSLMSNEEVLRLNQTAVESHPGELPADPAARQSYPQRYWIARTGGAHPRTYIAVFNLADAPTKATLPWMVFHLPNAPHALYNVWEKQHIPAASFLQVQLPAHGCALFRLE
ncbi:MAG: glycoside hydrolase family 27 protein [Acidobacteriota bacterium]|nr:glycoside hydrolase family 27 protein [Acidobacteriota bacterium]